MAGSVAVSVEAASVGIADRDDDAGLRRLMRQSVMAGAVRIAFTREPDFFAGDGLAGASDVTVVARLNGAIVGSGRCSIYPLLCNGVVRRIGYLSLLRVAGATRQAATLIRDGYELLGAEVRPLADGFFTSIASDNERARRVLERGGRLGLPSYRPLCQLVTLVAPVRRVRPLVQEQHHADELLEFLSRQGREFQLGLDWSAELLRDLARHGVNVEDFAIVRRQGRIVAAGAVWDQRPFRQTVIDGYDKTLARFRTLINAGLVMRGRPTLPAPGTILGQGVLLGAMARDAGDWPALWRELQWRAAERGLSWLTISRDARDPELSVMRRLTRAREYHTTLYGVTWPGDQVEPWDDRLFRPEVGLL